jgi:hypothetical protein
MYPHLVHYKCMIWESLTHIIQWNILILGKDINIIVFLRSPLKKNPFLICYNLLTTYFTKVHNVKKDEK